MYPPTSTSNIDEVCNYAGLLFNADTGNQPVSNFGAVPAEIHQREKADLVVVGAGHVVGVLLKRE